MLKTISENNLVKKKIKDLAADITGDAGILLIREVSVVFSGPGGGGGILEAVECVRLQNARRWGEERRHGTTSEAMGRHVWSGRCQLECIAYEPFYPYLWGSWRRAEIF